MKIITLTRYIHSPGYTLGVLVSPGFACWTLERPWLDNQPSVSCIPPGEYIAAPDPTGRYKFFTVRNVPGRTGIEIHPGNVVENSQGCILLGRSNRWVGGHPRLLDSLDVCLEMKAKIREPFILRITAAMESA